MKKFYLSIKYFIKVEEKYERDEKRNWFFKKFINIWIWMNIKCKQRQHTKIMFHSQHICIDNNNN